MKRILFPTDFSKNAEQALKYAISLCELMSAELVVLHSCRRVEAFAYQLLEEETNEELIIEKAKEELDIYCSSHCAGLNNFNVIKTVEYGHAVDNIIKSIKKYKVDLVVMGTKGAMGLNEIIFGSNTASTIFKASCPVLSIPEKTKIKKINQIAFATDYRENDIDSINFLATIAGLLKAKIFVVHVADFFVPEDYENALLRVFEEDIKKKVQYKNISYQVLRGNNSTKVINSFLKENYIDMLAVSTRRKNIFTKLFDTSFTKKMAYHSSIPLLAFHVRHLN
jgi:nucleotide-binding universal stress UspA family protein